jgi:nicotinamide-nucleotide amidase
VFFKAGTSGQESAVITVQEGVDAAERIAKILQSTGQTAAAAESLTGGNVGTHLAAAGGASQWFRGAIVAYASEVKFSVLDVEPGPVITEACARQMALGVAKVLGADFAVSTTGAGGPGEEEGRPAGTVFVAVASPRTSEVREYHFEGDPEEVVRSATGQALQDLAAEVVRLCES